MSTMNRFENTFTRLRAGNRKALIPFFTAGDPALESSHAVAQAIKLARELPKDALVLCNLSGRGDKDVHTIAAREGLSL